VVKKILFLASIFGLTIISTLWISFGSIPTSEGAGTPAEISGYAWSSNIGWINFKGSSYGVVIDPDTGILSGYAWSSNIGWISFNISELTGCPTNPCNAKYSNSAFSGWAKALSADGNGWDGWIHLSPTSGTAYGLTTSGTTISGFAWGGEVVGWVKPINMSMTPLTDTCENGLDDDNDGYADEYDVDCGQIIAPPGVDTPGTETTYNPQCNNGVDDDNDNLKDYSADTDCTSILDNSEMGSVAPEVTLKIGIGSPAFESLNIGKGGANVKLGINISNASTTTICSKKTISGGITSSVPVNTGGLTTYNPVPENLNITKATKIEVTCTTGNKTGSDSVDIIIKRENEF
jgi:hypothetical protein